MTFDELLGEDLDSVFFEEFTRDAIYSVSGSIVKVIMGEAIDMSSGYQYKTAEVRKSDIGIFDPSATLEIDGLKYGLVNETVNNDYTDIYIIRLTKQGMY